MYVGNTNFFKNTIHVGNTKYFWNIIFVGNTMYVGNTNNFWNTIYVKSFIYVGNTVYFGDITYNLEKRSSFPAVNYICESNRSKVSSTSVSVQIGQGKDVYCFFLCFVFFSHVFFTPRKNISLAFVMQDTFQFDAGTRSSFQYLRTYFLPPKFAENCRTKNRKIILRHSYTI